MAEQIRTMRLSSLFLLLSCLLLAACSQPEPPLRIGSNVWPGYEPLYLARSLNLLAPEDARMVEFPTNSAAMESWRDKSIEAAALTLDEALLLLQTEPDVRVALVMDYSNGADAIVARPQFKTLRDLKGQRIGFEDTAGGAYMLDSALRQAGLGPNDVQLVPMPTHRHEAAYKDGSVDALVTFEPNKSRLMAAGAIRLFDSSQIPGKVIDVLVVRANLNARQQEQMQGVIRAWYAALDYLKQHPQDAALRMAPRMKLDAKEVTEAFSGIKLPEAEENRSLLLGKTPQVTATASEMAKLMIEHELLQPGINAEKLIDSQLLEKLYP